MQAIAYAWLSPSYQNYVNIGADDMFVLFGYDPQMFWQHTRWQYYGPKDTYMINLESQDNNQ